MPYKMILIAGRSEEVRHSIFSKAIDSMQREDTIIIYIGYWKRFDSLSYEDGIKRLIADYRYLDTPKITLIVIDDIGRENYTDRRKEIAFRIVDTILNYQVTAAFTANPESIARLSKIDEWGAVLDRLKDICAMQIKFNGESLRGRAW